jgi:hypothetical protein
MSPKTLSVWAAGIVILLCLGACDGPPWALNKTPDQISLRWYSDTTPSGLADQVAELHCQGTGRNAELVTHEQDGSADIAQYRCR